jgi:hypothetical protein
MESGPAVDPGRVADDTSGSVAVDELLVAGVEGLLGSVDDPLYVLPRVADGPGILRLRELLSQSFVLLQQPISFPFHLVQVAFKIFHGLKADAVILQSVGGVVRGLRMGDGLRRGLRLPPRTRLVSTVV